MLMQKLKGKQVQVEEGVAGLGPGQGTEGGNMVRKRVAEGGRCALGK
jgi:hypothetical protein